MKKWLSSLGMFESATLRLTAWYVLLLMVLSVLFSLILFHMASGEFNRALAPREQGEVRIFIDNPTVDAFRQQRIDDSNARLLGGLVLFNLGVLVGGTALSYVLARRTLRPIEDAHNAQVRFASDAAHELRTPLAVMQTEMEVGLRDTKATKSEHAAILKSSLEEVERLRSLTDRLLLLASQQELPAEHVNLEEVTMEAIAHSVALAQAKNIAVENAVDSAQLRAHFDSVVTVLGIILDNAIKYSPVKTQITVTSQTSDKWVEISVSDQGPGIAADEQQKIFDRFYRVDPSRSSENVPGHGLGLSLAKRLVHEMHGEIAVVSDSGKGATFTVRLPRAA